VLHLGHTYSARSVGNALNSGLLELFLRVITGDLKAGSVHLQPRQILESGLRGSPQLGQYLSRQWGQVDLLASLVNPHLGLGQRISFGSSGRPGFGDTLCFPLISEY
jgi:hypothetical protein